ncbi:uncharacterized protein EV422DRAFT_534892 [Fimicolochytrium jonesii]|uniref:uncharacterized protein n=1 Tax=Fimicolochytrium jonesii TaxID=1396493 RepID=UPI0022FF0FBA|nr:uncharacterized protein EV422DRAFT_534892 [Fimicolochytrium jonesii]KAI8819478.1 hypothetical protein EV422DRAFT_534892 [Fimicolochytrium jonesii]
MSDPDRPKSAVPPSSADGAKPTKKGKKKTGKKKLPAIPRDMALNAKGELVPSREYVLEQTLEATSKSLDSYRERMTGLVHTNEDLQEAREQQEKDALDVISALHRENEKRELRIKELREKMEESARLSAEERGELIEEYERKISDLSTMMAEKEAAYNVMQQEFSTIKDFRKKRHDLIKELEQQKILLTDTERRHGETVARMERKFFEEKIRLQKEANRKISELATKAHKEAVSNLKETEKEVFRQNMRMTEALRYHVQEGEELNKANAELVLTNKQLLEEKNLHDVMVKEKILQNKQQSKDIKEQQQKIQSLEHTLSHVVREFERERDIMAQRAQRELQEVRTIAAGLKESLDRKSKEMRHIKRLAQHILDQRTDLERFFMDALDHVRGEIEQEQENAKKAVQAEYTRRMKAILTSKGIPTPQPTTDAKAGALPASIIMPLPAPPSPAADSAPARVDLSDLTWADKERIMRLLFARMNGVSLVGKTGGNYADAPPPASLHTSNGTGESHSAAGTTHLPAPSHHPAHHQHHQAENTHHIPRNFNTDLDDDDGSGNDAGDEEALMPVIVTEEFGKEGEAEDEGAVGMGLALPTFVIS